MLQWLSCFKFSWLGVFSSALAQYFEMCILSRPRYFRFVVGYGFALFWEGRLDAPILCISPVVPRNLTPSLPLMLRRHTQRHLTQVSVDLSHPVSTPLAEHLLSVLFYTLVGFIYAEELVYRLAIWGVFGLCQNVTFGLNCAEVPRVASP